MAHPELYRHVVESSADGLWVLDAAGRTVFVNQRLADMLRTEREGMEGRDHTEFLDEAGRDQWAARLAHGSAPDLPVECLFRRGDGTDAWFLVTEAQLPCSAGGGDLLLLSLSDFDDRRRLEAELEENRRELLEAHRVAGLGSWTLDLGTDRLTFSPTLLELFGTPDAPGSVSWRDTLDRFGEERRALVTDATDRVAAGDADSATFDLRVDRGHGERWLRVRLEAQHADGRVVGLAGTAQDVTEAHRAEMALHDLVRQNQLMRAVAVAANASQTLGEALTACGPLVVQHDRWRRARTFETDAELTEWPLSFGTDVEPADPGVPARERETARRALAGSAPVWDERGLTVACPILASGVPVAVIVMTSDPPLMHRDTISDMVARVAAQLSSVADREATAHELARARDAAMEASRLKSEFLATMSHEIRTPLNGVIGLNDLLGATMLDGHQQRLVDGVGASGRALLGLVDDVLDFSKIEAGQLVLETIDVDVRSVLDDVSAMTAESARARRVAVVMRCEYDVPALLRGDRVRLTQVVSNLVSNAVKFTEDGEVHVHARVVDGRDGPAGDAGQRLLVEVTDTGVGIEPDRVRTVFDPFVQADASTTREFGGTGLGLAIVREIVAASGGEVGVRSEPGSGSTFWFAVPLVVARRAGTIEDLAGRRARVVDGHRARDEALRERLAHWGMDVGSEPADVVLVGPGTAGEVLSHGSAPVVDLSEQPVSGETLCRLLRAALTSDDGARSAAPAQAAGATPPADGRRGRVLVVEDTPLNQLVAEGVLAALGYDSEAVDDGIAALDRLARDPGFDLVLMDVQMPRMDGYATVRAIRERETAEGRDRLPVVAMTAAAVTGERERCLEAGMDDFLTKPVSPTQLGAVLTERLARTTAPSGSGTPLATLPDMQADDVPVDLLPHLDLERLDMLRDLDPGNTAYVDRVIGNFVRRTPELATRIAEAVDGADADALTATAHRLRGSALNLGVPLVAETALALEMAGETGDLGAAPALLAELQARLEVGRQAVLAYRRSYGGDAA